MTDPTIKDITRSWLLDNGYEGLWNCDTDCSCRLDDLMPCDQPWTTCRAGVLLDAEDVKGSGHGFLIGQRDGK